MRWQAAIPEEKCHLLEGHLLRQIGDDVALIDEPAVGAVHHRDLRLRSDDTLEAGNVGGAHKCSVCAIRRRCKERRGLDAQRLASWRGLVPGCGPFHTDAGRMMRRSDIDSST